MKVVILCGGMGTRLREETEFRPKPMVEIGGRPILWHIMKGYAHHGFLDFVLCLGYKGNIIKEYFLNYEAMNSDFSVCLGHTRQITYHNAHEESEFRVTLADTGLDSMTGGRIKRIKRYIGNDDYFMMTYGDGVSDVDLTRLSEFHLAHGKIATVTAVRPLSRFGIMDLDRGGEVLKFAEKPLMEGWMSAGFFVLNRRIFDYLPDDGCIFEREPMERLSAAGELVAYQHEGFFHAMDTYREYQFLNDIWSKGNAPWRIWK